MSGRDPTKNHLLRALSLAVRARLFPQLEFVTMRLGEVVYERGDLLRHVYFPIDCIISLLYTMLDGASAEIAVVGNEGVVGVALFMGDGTTTSRAVVHSPGSAFRLAGQLLKAEFDRNGQMQALLLRYTQSLILQVAQTAACNRHHSLDQQLCRWLLLSVDRMAPREMTATQELIANMLTVPSQNVSASAGKLQDLGVIRNHRGRITVVNRSRLEQLSCECYSVVKRETERLLQVNHVLSG